MITLCDRCDGVHVGAVRCVEYEVWLDAERVEEDHARKIWAVSADAAAEQFARRYDYESGELTDCELTVAVRLLRIGALKRLFRVTVVVEPEYRAEEV